MPPLISKGPSIPQRLLHQHEEGNVVFFCGAGISRPAGLPGYGCLLNKLYFHFHPDPGFIGWEQLRDKRFDAALSLLEKYKGKEPGAVRKKLYEILSDWKNEPERIHTHQALMTLAETRDKRVRLVTTNCDRIFESVIEQHKYPVERAQAPALPIPKKLWQGIVYLHGLLPETYSKSRLDQLVFNSGDFGLAYLTEGWATRFVVELLRNYTLCFVGYRIDDPMLRYIMDAIAADMAAGQSWNTPYAFGSFNNKEKEREDAEWRAKNVEPILYDEVDDHRLLHETLRRWAEIYRDGAEGKSAVISLHAGSEPLNKSHNEPDVGQILWAISDAAAASLFAKYNPVPSIQWLNPIFEEQYGVNDLELFELSSDNSVRTAEDMTFSFGRRPAQLLSRPRMSLISNEQYWPDLDDNMVHLGDWLCRHLGDPKLLEWVSIRGGRLHPTFKKQIVKRLESYESCDNERIAEIKKNAPKAIPGKAMKVLWDLVLSDRLATGPTSHIQDVYVTARAIAKYGLSYSRRTELLQCLKPAVYIGGAFSSIEPKSVEEGKISDYVHCEVCLGDDHIKPRLREFAKSELWIRALPELLDGFERLLDEALELNVILADGDYDRDESGHFQPSISDHSQNQSYRDWLVLIELTRDAWEQTAAVDSFKAQHYVEKWWASPHPLHKRMALHAGKHTKVINLDMTVKNLLADNARLLWDINTMREVCRFLDEAGSSLSPSQNNRIEQAILMGPDAKLFGFEKEPDDWSACKDREVWLRLAKLESGGADLGSEARNKLKDIREREPQWEFEDDHREEFNFWLDHDIRGVCDREETDPPAGFKALVHWLCDNPKEPAPWKSSAWRSRCQADVKTAVAALKWLAQHDKWLKSRWNTALYAWAEEQCLDKSWKELAAFFMDQPDDRFYEIINAYTHWIERIANKTDIVIEENQLVRLIQPAMNCTYEIPAHKTDPISDAINHPIGHVTQALMHCWYKQERMAGDGLHDPIKKKLTELMTKTEEGFQHARTILAVNSAPLYWASPEWASEYIVPLFNWRNSTQASSAWKGFLFSMKLYRPFIEEIRESALKAAEYIEEIDKYDEAYSRFMTYVALNAGDLFADDELRSVFDKMPVTLLEASATALLQCQEAASGEREAFWKNRTKPFLEKIWPSAAEKISEMTSERFAELVTHTGKEFKNAVEFSEQFIAGVRYPSIVYDQLEKQEYCLKEPEAVLLFLSYVIKNTQYSDRDKINEFLKAIINNQPELKNNEYYIKIDNIINNAS
jgi:hypothetical protein